MSDTIVIDGEVELLNVIDGDPDVCIGGGGSQPTGTKSILLTEAGTKTEDVTAYASAEINAVKDATASGAVASFSDGAEDVPMGSCMVNIEPVQSGSGDPSPSNVRPISGWSEVNVYVSPTQSEQDATLYPISLGQTVYGGTLDVVTGVLTVTHKHIIMDGATTGMKFTTKGSGNTNNYYFSLYDGYLFEKSSGWVTASDMLAHDMISSHFPDDGSNTPAFRAYIGDNGTSLQPRAVFGADSAVTTVELANQWLADQYENNTPFEFVYPLATPTTVQLTPTEVTTLLGNNSVWADSGSISVGYKADIFLYADSLETIIDTLTGGA